MMNKNGLVLLLSMSLSACGGCGQSTTRQDAFQSQGPPVDHFAFANPLEINPALPNVLLIGDSISWGYTVPVRERLRGVANVFHPDDNCNGTAYGLLHLDEWLRGRQWQVIHFNFGLRDMSISPDAYRVNLIQFVHRLKETHARLIYAMTTPVPFGDPTGRREHQEIILNRIATEIMVNEEIPIDNLWLNQQIQPYQIPHDAHYTDAGYQVMGFFVSQSIRMRLL